MNTWDQKFKVKQYIYGTEPNQFFKDVRKMACYPEKEDDVMQSF